MTFDEHCDRLMLVDTLRYGLAMTQYVDSAMNLSPEEQDIRRWRAHAHDALRIELARRPPPYYGYEEDGQGSALQRVGMSDG